MTETVSAYSLAAEVFERLPYGLLVVDSRGEVVGANPLAVDLLHLRPGDRRDRRRRSDPHWLKGPEIRVLAFGRTHVDSAEGRLGGRWLQQRSGQLLKYLVAQRRRVVHSEEIAAALWP